LEYCGTFVGYSPEGNTLMATSDPNPYLSNELYILHVLSLEDIKNSEEVVLQEPSK
jgi:hypothetical protein